MAVRLGSPAPYGPPAGVLSVIHGFRDRGLSTPFTDDVLLRAGISESLVPRVYKSLEGLDLIDKDGNPTPQLVDLRQAKTDDFQATLADVVRSAYAEVLQFVNPATDDLTRITDAFRSYEPAGQRSRMITLFMGLCEAAGMTPPSDKKAKASATPRPPRTVVKGGSVMRDGRKQSSFAGPAGARISHGQLVTSNGVIPPALVGLLQSVPQGGWTQAERDKFVAAFGHVLDFAVPIIEKPRSVEFDDLGGDDDE
jgi:hypothetical protein